MSELIAIGASSGGLEAINKILALMPVYFATPVVLVIHFPRNADVILDSVFHIPQGVSIQEVQDKMTIESQNIYFAPPGYHLLVEKNRTFSLNQDDPVNFSIPSIDVFFESAAEVYRHKLIGVLLTGANSDGANGLKVIQEFGGTTYVQNPTTAAMPVMPEAALRIMQPDGVLNLQEIGMKLFEPPMRELS
jgi:two-component system chemotaxis response regulator CheB